ncbi:MAG: hypothetical protein CMJ49_13510 [Planctomycetaceae bacterium]|nr:hypothetical protein [Planctomycetaceae bacterium]
MNDTAPPKPRKMDRITRRLIWLTIIVIVLLVCFAGYRHVLRRSVEAKLQAIRDAGHPATTVEFAARYPPIDGPNACEAIVVAAAMIDVTDPKFKALPFSGEGHLPGPSDPLDPDVLQLLEDFVTENHVDLTELHRATAIDPAQLNVNYALGLEMNLPALATLRTAAKYLNEEALLHLERDHPDKAVDTMLAALRVGQALRNDHCLIIELVRIACDRIAVDTFDRCLQRINLTDQQLARVDHALQAAEHPEAFSQAMQFERVCGIDLFDRIARDPSYASSPWWKSDFA